MSAHGRTVCKCGAVVAQCRCPEQHGPQTVVDMCAKCSTVEAPAVATPPVEVKPMHPGTAFLLQFFKYEHLPPHLQVVSRPFCELAAIVAAGPQNAETTACLRKLREAKDCAVCAVVAK